MREEEQILRLNRSRSTSSTFMLQLSPTGVREVLETTFGNDILRGTLVYQACMNEPYAEASEPEKKRKALSPSAFRAHRTVRFIAITSIVTHGSVLSST